MSGIPMIELSTENFRRSLENNIMRRLIIHSPLADSKLDYFRRLHTHQTEQTSHEHRYRSCRIVSVALENATSQGPIPIINEEKQKHYWQGNQHLNILLRRSAWGDILQRACGPRRLRVMAPSINTNSAAYDAESILDLREGEKQPTRLQILRQFRISWHSERCPCTVFIPLTLTVEAVIP